MVEIPDDTYDRIRALLSEYYTLERAVFDQLAGEIDPKTFHTLEARRDIAAALCMQTVAHAFAEARTPATA